MVLISSKIRFPGIYILLCDIDPCMDAHCERGRRCVPDYQRGTATCECTSFCPDSQDSDEVCGANGKWYPSLCWLELAACQLNTTISVVHTLGKEFCGSCMDMCIERSLYTIGTVSLAVSVVRPGSCPDILSEPDGVCQDSCSLDFQCPSSQKCCFSGCGHSCVEAIFDKGTDINGCRQSNLFGRLSLHK